MDLYTERIFNSYTVQTVTNSFLTDMLKDYVLFAGLKQEEITVKNVEGHLTRQNLMNLTALPAEQLPLLRTLSNMPLSYQNLKTT